MVDSFAVGIEKQNWYHLLLQSSSGQVISQDSIDKTKDNRIFTQFGLDVSERAPTIDGVLVSR